MGVNTEHVGAAAKALADARRATEELQMDKDGLLEFVEASLQYGGLAMLASAAAHHAVELDVARKRFRQLGSQQEALRRIAMLIARRTPSEQLFAFVAEQVADVLDVPLVRIARYESEGVAIDCASFGRGRETPFPPGQRWSLEGTSVLSRVRNGRPARIDDYTDPSGPVAEHARSIGIQCSVGVPITVGSRIWAQ